MPEIHVNVREKIAQTVGTPEIVCGNSDYSAVFDLDSEWDDYDLKTAHFTWLDVRTGKMNEYELTFSGTICSIPAIYGTHLLLIGIYAGNIRTTTAAKVPCIRCITDDGSGESGHPAPQPDIYEQLLDAIGQIEPQPQPTPEHTVTAALDVPYYIGITQPVSPKGLNLAPASYESLSPVRKPFFYTDASYTPTRAIMYYTQEDRFSFADTLQEATGFLVKRSNSNFCILYPYDKDEDISGVPRVQMFYGSSGGGYVLPRVLLDASGNQSITINHQNCEMIYSSSAGYYINGPSLFYKMNSRGNLIMLGIGTGTDYRMDILLDKESHTIVLIPDGGTQIYIITQQGVFIQSLGTAASDASNVSLSRLAIPETGLMIPDVFITTRYTNTGYSREFAFGDDVYISSGNPVSSGNPANFVVKIQ